MVEIVRIDAVMFNIQDRILMRDSGISNRIAQICIIQLNCCLQN